MNLPVSAMLPWPFEAAALPSRPKTASWMLSGLSSLRLVLTVRRNCSCECSCGTSRRKRWWRVGRAETPAALRVVTAVKIIEYFMMIVLKKCLMI